MRKLASIQLIKELNPILGADRIEVATILGWKVIVKKGDFHVGSKVVYCEIDSILPDNPEFEFLRLHKFRIRTVRLRGQISQGVCFPISIVNNYGLNPNNLMEGQDITKELGVIKYEPPEPANLSGDTKGRFPSFVPKSDETRVQILQPILDEYKGTECYISEKMDGSSILYYVKDGEFGVCSRNYELKETETNSIWKLARILDIENKLKSFGT